MAEPRSVLVVNERPGANEEVGLGYVALPGRLDGGTGITVAAGASRYTVNMDIAKLEAGDESGAADQWWVPMWNANAADTTVRRIPVNVIAADAPSDNVQYARENGAWTQVEPPAIDWSTITGKPTTFPPTLPIPSSGVSGLDATQAEQDSRLDAAEADLTAIEVVNAAQDTAIGGKEPAIATGNPSYFWAGDKTWKPVPAAGIPEAPTDGQSYTRRGSDASWQVAAAGGGAAGVVLNPNDKAADLTLSNGNLTVVRDGTNTGGTNQRGVRGTTAKSNGKWVFAVDPVSVAGSTAGFWGLCTAAQSLTLTPLNSTNAAVGSFNGDLWTGAATQPFGAPTLNASQTEVQCAVDLDANRIWFRIGNGTWSNSGDPATGAGGYALGGNAAANPVYPCFFSNTGGDSLIFNFGKTAFANALPSGFSAWEVTTESPHAGAQWEIRLNPITIASSLSVPSGYNGMSAGPITIASGVTVDVASGSTWSIV